jgi:probable DNA metabolism protein
MEQIIYDGSYIGYLNAIEIAIAENADDIAKESKENLFQSKLYVESNEGKAKAFENRIKAIDPLSMQKIEILYLSEIDGFENIALEYTKNLFRNGKSANQYLTNNSVYLTNKICKDVLHEAHRFMGFIRFSELQDGTMIAIIAPKYNILSIIENHFCQRFGNLQFIIYDEIRKLAIINTKACHRIVPIPSVKLATSENEEEIRSLWRNFFRAIEIEGRKNLKIQQSRIPSKYRKNMTEFIGRKK